MQQIIILKIIKLIITEYYDIQKKLNQTSYLYTLLM